MVPTPAVIAQQDFIRTSCLLLEGSYLEDHPSKWLITMVDILPETNRSHLKIGRAPKGSYVSFREGKSTNWSYSPSKWPKWHDPNHLLTPGVVGPLPNGRTPWFTNGGVILTTEPSPGSPSSK